MRTDHAEDAALDLLVLGGCLDHEIAGFEVDEVGRGGDAGQGHLARGVLDLAFFDELGVAPGDPFDAGLGLRLRDIVEQDVEARQRADLGDSGAHLPGPDDANLRDVHCSHAWVWLAGRRPVRGREKRPSRLFWQGPG